MKNSSDEPGDESDEPRRKLCRTLVGKGKRPVYDESDPSWATFKAKYKKAGKYNKCAVWGCSDWVKYRGFCHRHLATCSASHFTQPLAEFDQDQDREIVSRLKRDKRLRAKHLMTVLLRQNSFCANTVKHCREVVNGEAVGECPFASLRFKQPEKDGMQLDHITPVSQGGTDDLSNLQALCAYCHAIKSAQERRAQGSVA